MLFSVIILSYNSQRTLNKCLCSLKNALSSFNELSEIIIIDNGSSDESPNIIRTAQQETPTLIKSIMFDHNTGTTVSRNAGLTLSTGKYVLILDSDAYINPKALLTLKNELDNDIKTGLVAPQLTYNDGRFQLSVDQFPTLKNKINRFLNLEKIQKKAKTTLINGGVQSVDYAISACWLLRRKTVDMVNGFDENIFYSPEDVDYCMQVWKNGYSIKYIPHANVTHDAQELSRGKNLSFFHWSHLKGLFYLFWKYKYFFGLTRLHKKIGRN